MNAGICLNSTVSITIVQNANYEFLGQALHSEPLVLQGAVATLRSVGAPDSCCFADVSILIAYQQVDASGHFLDELKRIMTSTASSFNDAKRA